MSDLVKVKKKRKAQGNLRSRGIEYSSGDPCNYKDYMKENPESTLSYEAWLNIIRTFNEMFREYLLQTGERERIPYGMGSIAVNKSKTIATVVIAGRECPVLPIDWEKSRIAGRTIRITNNHSDGFRFKWRYFRNESTMRMKELWCFKPNRETSRMIVNYVKGEDGHKYIEKWGQWGRHAV
jgi:hypothetical protein